MSKVKDKVVNISSHVDISYDSLSGSSSEEEHSDKRSVSNYEEVNDYSFLNIITEEITTVDSIKDINGLKSILNNSLTETNNSKSLDSSVYDNQISNLIKNLDNNEYTAVMHNIDNNSYLELVDQNNDSYTVQLQGNNFYSENNINIDSILTFLIEDHTHKLS